MEWTVPEHSSGMERIIKVEQGSCVETGQELGEWEQCLGRVVITLESVEG